jgi:hypothetical protein
MEETLTAMLAPVAGGRRYWVRAPQTAKRPFVVLQRITGLPNYHMQGASGYMASRVQADVYADTYMDTQATARSLISTLSGAVSGTIQAIFIDSVRDLPASDAGDVTQLFRTSIDLIVHHGEPT